MSLGTAAAGVYGWARRRSIGHHGESFTSPLEAAGESSSVLESGESSPVLESGESSPVSESGESLSELKLSEEATEFLEEAKAGVAADSRAFSIEAA
jgi:hypothetical protein